MLGVVSSNLKMIKCFIQHLWMLYVVVVGQVRETVLRLSMRDSLIFNSQHVATRCNRVGKRVQHVAPNNVAFGGEHNVAICCVQMLRSFGWSLQMLGWQCCYRLAGV